MADDYENLMALADDEDAFSMEALLGAARNPFDAAEFAVVPPVAAVDDGLLTEDEHQLTEDEHQTESEYDPENIDLSIMPTTPPIIEIDINDDDGAAAVQQPVPADAAMQPAVPEDAAMQPAVPAGSQGVPLMVPAGSQGVPLMEFCDTVEDEQQEGGGSDTEAEDAEDHHQWSVKPGHWGRSRDLDWHELRRLRHEQEIAAESGTPWRDRGPVPQSGAVRPGFWRGQSWRAGTERWSNRGGRNKDYYAWLARGGVLQAGKSSGKSSGSGGSLPSSSRDGYKGKDDKGKGEGRKGKDGKGEVDKGKGRKGQDDKGKGRKGKGDKDGQGETGMGDGK
jgi:hypothetical protein